MTYSLAKRFTWWPHLWLGLSLAIAPVGGWLAVTGAWSEPWWLLLAITVAVATWVAGFDIFYALPDEAFDRERRPPERRRAAGRGARHPAGQAAARRSRSRRSRSSDGRAGFGPVYFAGLVVAAGILAYEHRLVRPGDLSRLDAAFFTMNGVMSVTVFLFALADRLL